MSSNEFVQIPNRKFAASRLHPTNTGHPKWSQHIFGDTLNAENNGLPACMPMIALLKEEELGEESEQVQRDEGLSRGFQAVQRIKETPKHCIYLHGHPSTRLMELVRIFSRGSVGDAISTEGINNDITRRNTHSPVKVCITATQVDGLALSSAPNGHTFNYRSATIHGTCSPVDNRDIKKNIMRAVTNHIVANRWEEVNPVAGFQISLVYVIKVEIDRLSVKVRTGPPGIQARDREADGPDSATPPWTGVIPVWNQLGEPVESGLTPEGKVSESLRGYITERNERMQLYSERAAIE